MPRQKEFDPDEALEKAMHTFWAKGYYDTSIRDLVAATGVSPYGLYSTFEDKRGLFLAALDRYNNTVAAEIVSAMKGPETGLAAIHRAFDRALELTRPAHGHKGCLMCLTAVEFAPHDSDAADKVQRNMAALQKAFRGAIEQAQDEGNVPGSKDASALAEFLTTTLYGSALLARSGQSPAVVKRHIQTALKTLG